MEMVVNFKKEKQIVFDKYDCNFIKCMFVNYKGCITYTENRSGYLMNIIANNRFWKGNIFSIVSGQTSNDELNDKILLVVNISEIYINNEKESESYIESYIKNIILEHINKCNTENKNWDIKINIDNTLYFLNNKIESFIVSFVNIFILDIKSYLILNNHQKTLINIVYNNRMNINQVNNLSGNDNCFINYIIEYNEQQMTDFHNNQYMTYSELKQLGFIFCVRRSLETTSYELLKLSRAFNSLVKDTNKMTISNCSEDISNFSKSETIYFNNDSSFLFRYSHLQKFLEITNENIN